MSIFDGLMDDRTRLGLLAMGTGMMGAPSLDVGMKRGFEGLLGAMTLAQAQDERRRREVLAERELRMREEQAQQAMQLHPLEMEKLKAEAEYRKALAEGRTGDPDLQIVPTSKGWVKLNKRTGDVMPAQLGEETLLPAYADPSLKAQMSAANEAPKGVDAIDEEGRKYRAPQFEVNPSFGLLAPGLQALIPGIIQQESSGRADARSPAGAIGAMQLMPGTASNPGYGVKPAQNGGIQENIRTGSDYFNALVAEGVKRHGDTQAALDWALSAYNQGPGNADKRGIANPDYVQGVLSKSGIVKGPSLLDEVNIEAIKKQQSAEIENQQKTDQLKNQRSYDASGVMDLVSQIEPLLDKATGSGFGAMYDSASALFGKSPAGAEEAAQLKALGGVLVSKMPKMNGPQSDKDVQLYKEMAGNIGDPTIPAAQKKAALKTIKSLNEKYLSESADDSKPQSLQERIAAAKRRAGL